MKLKTISIATFLLFASAICAVAQDQPAPAADPIQQLNLTPEQRQRIRRLTQESREERQLTNRRVREANVALDQALDADPVDQSLVEQRINELAAAQAAQLRMRINMELRIRRVLHPEQLTTLRRLRLQLRQVVAPRRPNARAPIRRKSPN